LHRVREVRVGMAIADRKEECRTADQFYCGGIFYCNSDNSKSTEACGKLSGEGQVSPPPIMPKLNRLKMFKKEHRKSPTRHGVAFGNQIPLRSQDNEPIC
jgi:hypothetical protein